MPGIVSPHGTTVWFAGRPIGHLTGYDIEAKAGDVYEKTHVSSRVVGSGLNARVVREYDVTSVEPATVSLTFWGPPSYSVEDCGTKAGLVFDGQGIRISGEAILMSWSYSGRPNQWSNGAATFQLTGATS